MIITKDMLLIKGCPQEYIDDFELNFPSWFDFSVIGTETSITFEFVTELAYLFGFLGLYTREDYGYIYQLNFINGYLNDFPNGNPAYIEYEKPDGISIVLCFYKNGRLNNPTKYLPAELGITEDKVSYRSFWEDDTLQDPYPHVPATRYFDEDGYIIEEWYSIK